MTTWAAIGVTNAGVTRTGDEVRRTRVVLRLFFFLIAIAVLYVGAVRMTLRRLSGYNKATIALANKLARIAWATWKHQRPFDGNWAQRSSTA